MISVNERAAEILRRMVAQAEVLGVAVHTLSNGATVIDAGIKVAGSFAAGKLFAEACLGGLGEVEFAVFPLPPKACPEQGRRIGGD